MSLKHLADNIAAHGRHGDDTLIHVDKGELTALKALAAKHGRPLTTNPDTGLPEAFGLRQILPMAAGAVLAGPVGMSAVNAAMLVGGVSALASGNLRQGVLDGLGAWGGGSLATAGTQVAGQKAVEEGAKEAAVSSVPSSTANFTATGSALPAGTTNFAAPAIQPISGLPAGYPAAGVDGVVTGAYQNAGLHYTLPAAQTTAFGVSSPTLAATATQPSLLSTMGANVVAHPSYALAAAAPAISNAMQPPQYEQPNIKGDSDMGPRYLMKPGYSNDIPGRTGPASYERIGAEEARKYYGFAEGGEVDYPYGEPVVRMADGGGVYSGLRSASKTMEDMSNKLRRSFGMPVRDNANVEDTTPTDYSNYYTNYYQQARPSQYAAPMDPSGYEDAPITQSLGRGFQYGPMQTVQDASGAYNPVKTTGDAIARDFSPLNTITPEKVNSDGLATLSELQFARLMREQKARNAVDNTPTRDYTSYYQQARQAAPTQYSVPVTAGYETSGNGNSGYESAPATGLAAAAPVVGKAAGGGISTLGGYSDGGRLLKGPGDGMSDNIPAQIGAKQPARLADGEFVVPADVVSHLGNGSTDAGAKQLYKMMDKVRAARTGNKRQGKQINPNKFTPA